MDIFLHLTTAMLILLGVVAVAVGAWMIQETRRSAHEYAKHIKYAWVGLWAVLGCVLVVWFSKTTHEVKDFVKNTNNTYSEATNAVGKANSALEIVGGYSTNIHQLKVNQQGLAENMSRVVDAMKSHDTLSKATDEKLSGRLTKVEDVLATLMAQKEAAKNPDLGFRLPDAPAPEPVVNTVVYTPTNHIQLEIRMANLEQRMNESEVRNSGRFEEIQSSLRAMSNNLNAMVRAPQVSAQQAAEKAGQRIAEQRIQELQNARKTVTNPTGEVAPSASPFAQANVLPVTGTFIAKRPLGGKVLKAASFWLAPIDTEPKTVTYTVKVWTLKPVDPEVARKAVLDCLDHFNDKRGGHYAFQDPQVPRKHADFLNDLSHTMDDRLKDKHKHLSDKLLLKEAAYTTTSANAVPLVVAPDSAHQANNTP